MSTQSFADLGVSTAVVNALTERGIERPFPVQELVVRDVLAGQDVLTKSPTGSGKTLAFGIPMADRLDANGPKQTALILAPTRELASQIVDEMYSICHAKALAIAAVYGGAGIEKQSKAARKAHIIVATPGRLEDLIQRGAVKLSNVQILVLDEADRMLDMGFRPVVDRIVRQTHPNRQTLFFSATLDGEVGKLANEYTSHAKRHEHHSPAEERGYTEHRFIPVQHEAKLDTLVADLRSSGREGRTLVFVRTKRGADRLVKKLERSGIKSVAMHGNKSQNQREKALSRFEQGQVSTLVATDVAARGIDVEGITHVINFDAPEDHEGYVHRIGRTARAGAKGVGITYVLADQAHDIGKIASKLELHEQFASSGIAVKSRGGGGQRQGGQRPRNGNGGGPRNGNRNQNRNRNGRGRR
ncbi:MAG: DEAD/DEAH box helicase [Thermoleophilaceae bacterium]|nr:DEAD/DEAH box helicase [Thermoleophilaceae bacterium]